MLMPFTSINYLIEDGEIIPLPRQQAEWKTRDQDADVLQLGHSYSRGFISQIRGTLEAILTIGPKIAKENPLESVNVSNWDQCQVRYDPLNLQHVITDGHQNVRINELDLALTPHPPSIGQLTNMAALTKIKRLAKN